MSKRFAGGLFTGKKPTPLTALETDISAQIADYLNAKGIYNVRVNSGGLIKTAIGTWIHLAPKGTPDRFACHRGLLIAIEVKRPGEKPTNDQLEQHELIRNSGGIVVIAHRVEDIAETINRIDEEHPATE